MSKSIEYLVLFILFIMLVGCLLIPANPIFWLASPETGYSILRFLLIILISTIVILGTPPSTFIKFVFGVTGAALTSWALFSTYTETMQLLDGLSLAAAGVVLGIEALSPVYLDQAEENWEGIISKFRPLLMPIERIAVAYAFLLFITVKILSTHVQIDHSYIHTIT